MRFVICLSMQRAVKDSYLKEKKVGEGTYAVVYLGKQQLTARPIAIKEIKTSAFKDGLDMLALREMKFLRELEHPNIIELVDVFSTPDNLNLVLEFLPADLEQLIKDKEVIFTPADVKSWLLMTLRGVHHCHRNNILHRDLKPNNLLLAPDGQLKIADFGLARAPDRPQDLLTSNVVTRWYRAPELLLGARHYTGAVDVWLVGAIFAELMLRIPYLAGPLDAEQLDVTFRALGTPTEDTWPHVLTLPGYNNLKVYPPPLRHEMRNRFLAATEKALDLLMWMTTMCPGRRCDTRQALESEYFTELPRATEPSQLPVKGGKKLEAKRSAAAAGGARRRRRVEA